MSGIEAAMPKVLAFLLMGKVQGVKMRRYVESAARHFGVSGYVINTAAGHVFGKAWEQQQQQQKEQCNITGIDDNPEGGQLQRQQDEQQQLDQFVTWVRGQWKPAVYHNIKPTPIGTAYPEKARVHQCVTTTTILFYLDQDIIVLNDDEQERFATFTMIRDDNEAAKLASQQIKLQERLEDAVTSHKNHDNDHGDGDGIIHVCAWPEPP